MPLPRIRALAAVFAGLIAASVCGSGLAGERDAQLLAVLLVARDGADEAREARFIDELKLTLDGFDIKLVDPGPADFTALSLKDELGVVQSLTEPLSAAATIWIESASPDVTMLHVVALSTGRAFIRIVEAKQGPGAERELAIAADELLGQVYMLSPPPAAAPVEGVVEKVVEKAAALRERKSAVELDLATFFTTSGGLYRREGSWFRLGGGAALELWPAGGLLVRAGFSVVAGPFFDPDDGTVSGYGLHPELGGGYLWTLGRLRLGPVASAAAMRSTVTLSLGRGTAHTATWWSFHGALGVQARLALGPAVAVFLEPSVGVWSNPRRFERVSDGSVALRSPLVDWGATLGVCYTF
jgi:hypothetical protein